MRRIARAGFLFAALLLTLNAGPLAAAAQTAAPARGHIQASGAPSTEASTPAAASPEKKEEVRDENDEYRHSAAVRKMGSWIGLNPEQAATAFTLFNFAVLVICIGYALLKTLPKAFVKRSSAIQKQLVEARTATEEATARLNSVEARLAKLDSQIDAMRQQSKADAKRDEERMRASVEDEKAKIVSAAEAEISVAAAMARRDIQQYAADLAIEQAARKLIVSAETDRLLVASFAHKLGASGDKEEQN